MSSPPTTLGKYQIIREIARSNDIVYEAYDPLMNRRVALKELAMPSGSTNPQKEERVKRFLREAKAAGSLAHPNIVTIYEVGQEGERHYIAMEYLDGHTLRNELDTNGFLAPERAVEIITAVLHGLDYAHSNGVIHRDIKPDNIQLLSDGRIKLTDFGIARLTFEPNLTMDGQVFGTPSYMSPEQVVGRDIDARSDLFSVGIVLYEMLSGQKPFAGDSVVSITYAIMNKEPDRQQQISYTMWQVLTRALDKSAGLRYSSAKEMVAAVEEAQHAASAGPVLGAAPPIVAQPNLTPYGTPSLNPYITPPTGNPYTTPYPTVQPMAPLAPPISYPYNPYGQNPPQGSQPTIPPAFQYPNVPMQAYYPPPPRSPLIRPETAVFLRKLAFAVVLAGLSIGIVIYALNFMTGQMPGSPNSSELSPASKSVSGVGSSSNGSSVPGVGANNDSGYVVNPEAEATKGASNRAEADAATDSLGKAGKLELSAQAYERAYSAEGRQDLKEEYGIQAASRYYDLYQVEYLSGDRVSARQALYRARDVAPAGSQIAGEVNAEIDRLE